jgi:hypothetical protein
VEISALIEETNEVADKYNLTATERDRTDNIVSLRLLIDNELHIQIYGNAEKKKLSFALVFKERRLYGFDSEGGKYHCHSFDDPENHVFVDEVKTVREFVQESLSFLEERNLL